jgi:hypothetical protein
VAGQVVPIPRGDQLGQYGIDRGLGIGRVDARGFRRGLARIARARSCNGEHEKESLDHRSPFT